MNLMPVFLKRFITLASATLGLVLFFCIYSFLSFETLSGTIIRFNSPDETANYFFSKLYATKSQLGFEEKALAESKNFIHPRSMTVVVDTVKPVSFLGMTTFYGLLGKITGPQAILFLTPLIAVLAIPFYFLLIRSIFSSQVALISSLLLLIHPAYWYYASRSMMPNVLFTALCIIGFSLLLTSRPSLVKFVGGLFIGASLMVRFSEVLWVGALLVLLGILCIRRITLRDVVWGGLGVLIPILILLGMNNNVYGNPISFGYQTVDTSTAIRSLESSSELLRSMSFSSLGAVAQNLVTAAASLGPYILPFGFIPETFLKNFLDYGVHMFWWYAIPICFGIVWVLWHGISSTMRNRRLDNRLIHGLALALVGVWLVIFYGSWLFHDNITKNITIGNSYVRYWLPITVLAIPFAAQCFVALAERTRGVFRICVFSLLCGMFVFYGFKATLWEGPESLFAVAKELSLYREKALLANQITPENAVIFSERSDKIFFPDRRVAQVFNSFIEIPLVPQILASYPVYYYGFWSEKDAEYITRRYFAPLGLQLVYVATFDDNERLFQVIRNDR